MFMIFLTATQEQRIERLCIGECIEFISCSSTFILYSMCKHCYQPQNELRLINGINLNCTNSVKMSTTTKKKCMK